MSCYEERFRLNDGASICSMKSKAMIDALFEDKTSICSSMCSGWYASANSCSVNAEEENPKDGEFHNKASSAVQARIEAMFASVEAETGKPGETAAAILTVSYLGSAPVGGRVASVRGLQEPLRHLLEHMKDSPPAELEISRRGLTFRLQDNPEKVNPFRRIAVWSAVRLHSRPVSTLKFPSLPESTSPQPINVHHAFLPLVGDDSATETQEKYQDLYRTMRGLPTEVNQFPPIFAVIMRRPGAARILECHAFACKSCEDAIAAAATLYRALLADLDANRRRPRQTNGLGCVSLASVASSYMDNTPNKSKTIYNLSLRQSAAHPVRPPRLKKHSASTSTTDGDSCHSVENEISRRRKITQGNDSSTVEKTSLVNNGSKFVRNKFEQATSIRSMSEDSQSIRSVFNAVPNKSIDTGWIGNRSEGTRNVLSGIQNEKSTISNQENAWDASKSVKPQDKNENMNNLKNKFYSIGKDHENTISTRKMNCYEKTPIKLKTSYEPDRNYSFVEKNDSIIGELVVNSTEAQLYEKNHGSYEIERNFAISPSRSVKSSKKIDQKSGKILCNSIHAKSSGSKRNNREESYEEHFRDADRIFNVESDEDESFCARKSHKNPKGAKQKQKSFVSGEIRRVSRADVFEQDQRRDLMDDGFPQRGWRGEKKRHRAGSEPPLSKTENATKIVNDVKLKRSQSDLEVERGDLMTRVELPRRGSFLKPSSSTKLPNNMNGGTPLGFTELFDEFRNQEGLTSVDDILATIIDPEGMSFNDLKPLYKEFLLKLASTLTQDELYQRSAIIMKRRRRPQRRRSTRKASFLGRAIKRSVSKFKTGPTEFTSSMIPARKLNGSLDSNSSCDGRNHRNRVLASRLSRRRSSWRRSKGPTTSEDSDTCKRVPRSHGAGANRSSSGYVSCSECSYDSESCTCVSADKCYCSLPKRSPAETTKVKPVMCGCDTDSCSESNKCYCPRRPEQLTLLEQLRQRGIVPCDGTLSRAGSPERSKVTRSLKSQASTGSLEFKKVRPSPGTSSSDNLGLDYDLFSPGKKSQHSSGSEKVLVVSARDQQGRLVYVGGTQRNKKSLSRGTVETGAHHEALSIKKSAEIAAVFGPPSVRSCRRSGSISSLKSSISLEAGLGYLP